MRKLAGLYTVYSVRSYATGLAPAGSNGFLPTLRGRSWGKEGEDPGLFAFLLAGFCL